MHPHVFLGFFCILLWIDCIFCQAHNLTGASIPVSSPMQRFGHSTVLLPNGSLLIFGGHNYQLTNVELKTYIGLKNDLYLFDFATQNYTRINPERNTSLPSPRVHHSAVLLTDANGIFTSSKIQFINFIRCT